MRTEIYIDFKNGSFFMMSLILNVTTHTVYGTKALSAFRTWVGNSQSNSLTPQTLVATHLNLWEVCLYHALRSTCLECNMYWKQSVEVRQWRFKDISISSLSLSLNPSVSPTHSSLLFLPLCLRMSWTQIYIDNLQIASGLGSEVF